MSSRDCTGRAVHAIALALLLVAHARAAHAADAEPIALELRFDSGTPPCFTSAELATRVEERIGQSVSSAPVAAPPLAIVVHVRAAPAGGFDIAIDSRAPASGEIGQRELHVDGACDAIAAPLSLVIALMVGTAATAPPVPLPASPPPPSPPPDPAPAPALAPAPAPALAAAPPPPLAPAPPVPIDRPPPPPPSTAAADTRTGVVLSAAAGTDLAIAPDASALASVAARLDFERLRRRNGAYLGVALAAEFLASPDVDREGWTFSIAGAGVQAKLCGIWQRGWFSLEPSFGLWLRAFTVEGEGDAASHFEPAHFTLGGWIAGADLRAQIVGPWSVFAGLHGMTPFGASNFSVRERPPDDDDRMEEPPFFNSGMANAGEIVSAPLVPDRVQVHEMPVFTTVLLAGVSFAP